VKTDEGLAAAGDAGEVGVGVAGRIDGGGVNVAGRVDASGAVVGGHAATGHVWTGARKIGNKSLTVLG
jgi:hypothetical protein